VKVRLELAGDVGMTKLGEHIAHNFAEPRRHIV